jgi:hypothetical protein
MNISYIKILLKNYNLKLIFIAIFLDLLLYFFMFLKLLKKNEFQITFY